MRTRHNQRLTSRTLEHHHYLQHLNETSYKSSTRRDTATPLHQPT